MITEKAKDIGAKIRKLPVTSHWEALYLTSILVTELIENCTPTEDEFAKLTEFVLLSSRSLWRLIIHIPKWNEANEKAF